MCKTSVIGPPVIIASMPPCTGLYCIQEINDERKITLD